LLRFIGRKEEKPAKSVKKKGGKKSCKATKKSESNEK